jgi:molybdate/tungstate transport system substrate-binding protein
MNVSLRRRIQAFFLVAAFILTGCGGKTSSSSQTSGTGKTPLSVFAAGSLIIPFGDLEKAFEAKYPHIDVQAEYHGSIQVIRQVTDLHKPIDVVATADASLMPMLMYAVDDPDTGQPYADWYIRFATNRLALAYGPNSKYADEISSDNWTSILARPDVKVGLADPRFDAAGYRALMAFGLAQSYYHDPTIFREMFSGQFTYPLSYFIDDDLTTITVPEIVETKTGSHIVIRGASIQLVALLESGDLDYTFEYESVIRQHQLKFLQLPDSLNLGAEGDDPTYNTVQVNLDFQRFATVKPQFRGERIGYGITIPSNAPHPAEAALFISFLLGEDGRAIMEKDFHPLFDPVVCDRSENIPAALAALCGPARTP